MQVKERQWLGFRRDRATEPQSAIVTPLLDIRLISDCLQFEVGSGRASTVHSALDTRRHFDYVERRECDIPAHRAKPLTQEALWPTKSTSPS